MTKRRQFIKQSVMGTAGLAIGGLGFSAKSYGSIIGSNERVNIAVIGIRGQGKTHINRWCGLKENRNVNLKTLCDTDEQYFAPLSKEVMDSIVAFRRQSIAYAKVSEQAFYNARGLPFKWIE